MISKNGTTSAKFDKPEAQFIEIFLSVLLDWMLKFDVPTLTKSSASQYAPLPHRMQAETGDMRLFGEVNPTRVPPTDIQQIHKKIIK